VPVALAGGNLTVSHNTGVLVLDAGAVPDVAVAGGPCVLAANVEEKVLGVVPVAEGLDFREVQVGSGSAPHDDIVGSDIGTVHRSLLAATVVHEFTIAFVLFAIDIDEGSSGPLNAPLAAVGTVPH
jgi:hypothetical protein